MSRISQALDRQPGALPEIRTTVDNITFHMTIAGGPGYLLIIRCGSNGEIAMSIHAEPR
jgi:hypothetical protein